MRPILFEVLGFPVRSYGLMIALGLIFGALMARRQALRRGKYADEVYDFVFYAFFAAVAGARLWEVVFSWDYFGRNLSEIPAIWHGGLSIQGAVLGGVLAALWYARTKRLAAWEFLDILTPGLILGQAIGRVGCLLNGDAFGKPTDSFWGVVYQPGTPAYEAFGPQPLWPAETFEGMWDLVVLGILLLLSKRRLPSGTVALSYGVLYSAGRFMLEFLRADSLTLSFGIKAAQLTGVVTIVICLGLLYSRFRANPTAEGGGSDVPAENNAGGGQSEGRAGSRMA